ncbi:wee kinase [Cystoisospora suis]|uniref:non-specific serine/threonine protein kinase n=1 Tax=Cystoisospora suis TaxID=483139 RepID=A0A2C6L3F4_9APIC|nr:wee kinase [Cystoisospora suis]
MDHDKLHALVPLTPQLGTASPSAGRSTGCPSTGSSGPTFSGAPGGRQEFLTPGVHRDALNHPVLLALPDECGLLPIADSGDASSFGASDGSARCGMPAGELRLSTPISTESALQNNYEIVLYKNRNIVLFNPHTNRAGARSLTTAEERAIRLQHVAHCPLCGQTVDTQQFSFEAQTYFQILQHLFRRLRRRQCSQRSSSGHFSHYSTAEPAGASSSAYPTVELDPSSVSSHHGTAALPSFDSADAGVTMLPGGTPCSLPPSCAFGSSRTQAAGHAISSAEPATRAVLYSQVSDENSSSGRHQQIFGAESPSLAEPGGAETLRLPSARVNFPGTVQARVKSDGDDSLLFSSGTGADLSSSSEPEEYIPYPKNIPVELLITGYYNRFFVEKQKLGSGSYGQVYLCTHILDELTLGEYAVKKLPVGDNKHWLAKMLQEVKIREKLHHPNIVDYKHSWLEMHRSNPMCPWVPWLFVLMEYCNGESLEDLIWDQGVENPPSRYLTDDQIWKLFFDILFGLQHLHHSAILYRDMKPPNVLLQHSVERMTGRLKCRAQLSDFGTAELLGERKIRAERNGYTGTIEFTAPELLEVDDRGLFSPNYDMKSDVWSLGMILYAMCYARVPYADKEPSRCRNMILGHTGLLFPEQPPRHPTFKLLIQALTAKDPALRPSTDDILDDERVRQVLNDRERLDRAAEEIVDLLQKKRQRVDGAFQAPRSSSRRPGSIEPDVRACRARVAESEFGFEVGSQRRAPLVPLPAPGCPAISGCEGLQLQCTAANSAQAISSYTSGRPVHNLTAETAVNEEAKKCDFGSYVGVVNSVHKVFVLAGHASRSKRQWSVSL